MTDPNPYASPSLVEAEAPLGPEPRLGNVVSNTVRVLVAQWSTVLITLVLLCFPWELVFSYLTIHVLTYEQTWLAYLIGAVGQGTIVLFGQGLVMTGTSLYLRAGDSRLLSTVSRALASFPSLFLSSIVSSLGILLGCVLLIVPGFYLNLRWMYFGPAAVSEELSGLRPLRRSWELTNSRLLFSLTVFALYGTMLVFVNGGLTVLLEFSPTLQHWVLSAALATVSHFATLLVCIGFTCSYHELFRIQASTPSSDDLHA